MWKIRIFAVFSPFEPEKMRFSRVFRGFFLAFSKSLGYSPLRSGFSVRKQKESPRLASSNSRHEKIQEDKNTRWQPSQ
jgi:hypothetical protein